MHRIEALPADLQAIADELGEVTKKAGLDYFPTVFELVDYKQLNEIAAYGGFPTRYPHWRFGMEYEQLSKSYTYGLSIIYEMVINNNPTYAYLLRANNLVSQKMVIAHVYGHADFFKNNLWFSKTNRKMLDQMANHSSTIRRYIEDIGHDIVEDFIDCVLSLENLIDAYSIFQPTKQKSKEEDVYRQPAAPKLAAKGYMDKYINPAEFMAQQQASRDQKAKDKKENFPAQPERDVLKFLIDHAPLEAWQKRVLGIVRDEAYYFAPQMQTKIINEGWASYWHSMVMTKLSPLKASEIVDYCENHAGVVGSAPGQLNPYKLGIELLRHIEHRWNTGKHGMEYQNIEDPKKRAAWNTNAGKGMEKLFEVRKVHNDITFIQEYLDEDFCHEHKMFIYDYDKRSNKYVISSRNFADVKNRLLKQLTNFGQPIIKVVDANYGNRSELLLEHVYDGTDLDQAKTIETLRNLYQVWKRPVHITTRVENSPKRISFGPKGHDIQSA